MFMIVHRHEKTLAQLETEKWIKICQDLITDRQKKRHVKKNHVKIKLHLSINWEIDVSMKP